MITYICTAGTSIVTGAGLDLKHFAKRKLSEWDALDEEIEIVKQFAMDSVAKKSETDFPRTSAELNSLIKMGINSDDCVVLIATETIEGKLCAELVAKLLKDRKLCNNVTVKVIEGLQVQDGRRFQKVGLKNLMAFISEYEHKEVIFNPTGGFKSVVPYITLAGMLFNKPVKYIHEFSDDLTTLANIPIRFDEEVIFAVEDKLRKIEKDSAIGLNEWHRGISYHDSRFESLVEELDGMITMSGIGFLMWEKFKVDFPAEMTDEARQLERRRKQSDFPKIIQGHFKQLELSDESLGTLIGRAIDPRVLKCLHSIDHRQATPGMRWHTFEGGDDLWYARFSNKGRIYVQMRTGQKPLVTAIDYDKKLQ